MAKKKKKKKSGVTAAFGMAFKITFLILLIFVAVVGTIFYFKYGRDILKLQAEAKGLVQESTVDTFKQSQTSVVYDANEKVLLSLSGEKKLYYLNYEDIPNYAKQAMISIEDKNFTKHSGVDYKAIFRAGVAYIKHRGEITQGGSTITQQLARNIFLTHQVSWTRKVEEVFVSLEMEKKYTKYQILEFYLNNIYFSNGYYGIQAASKGYFNKTVDKLSLSQIAFLCSIPNNPTLYDPLDNMDNTLKRRDRILKQMLKDEWISESEYDEAVNEKIKLNVKKTTKKNYITTFVLYSATRALMENEGFEFKNSFSTEEEQKEYQAQYDQLYNECLKSLYSGGYQIYTSIDQTKQKKLQESVNDTLADFTDKTDSGVYKMQGAAVSIDNQTGRVVAIVGGRSQSSAGYTLNRAFQSYRQPGSSIKPLIVYTPAFEQGYTPSSYVEDSFVEGGPKNADLSYSGTMTVKNAVAKSKNTVAWKLYKNVTPKTGLSYILNMGFQKIKDQDYTLATGIGGFTVGVSPLEMASGFATIENDGMYREPTCIVKITDSDGHEIVGDDNDEKKVYKKNAARMMVDCLQEVMNSGTGASLKLDGMPCAGKTGTTNDKKDGWFVGFTGYYTTAVWVGCDTPESVYGLTGSSYPGNIWKTYMSWAHEGLTAKEFELYSQPESSRNDVSANSVNESSEDTENKDTTEENTQDQEPNEDDSQQNELEQEDGSDKGNDTSGAQDSDKQDKPSENTNQDGVTDFGGNDSTDKDPGWDEDENNTNTGGDTSQDSNSGNSGGSSGAGSGSDTSGGQGADSGGTDTGDTSGDGSSQEQ